MNDLTNARKRPAKRIEWLDSCKGFAMLMVVIGHLQGQIDFRNLFQENAVFLSAITNTIYSFHMPLFFCLSGYIFYSAYLKNKEEKIINFKLALINNIYIYFFWSLVEYLIRVIFSSQVAEPLSIKDFIYLPIHPIDVLWYIYMLTLYYILMYWLDKFKINSALLMVVILAISSIGGYFVSIPVFPLHSFLICLVFFAAGTMLSKYSEIKINKAIYIIFYVLSSILLITAFVFNIKLFSIKCIGVVFALIISLGIIFLFKNSKHIGKNKFFILLGNYSLEIYVTHNFLITINSIILPKIGINNFYLFCIINVTLSIALPVLCAWLLKKMKLHKLLFRPASYFYERKQKRKALRSS